MPTIFPVDDGGSYPILYEHPWLGQTLQKSVKQHEYVILQPLSDIVLSPQKDVDARLPYKLVSTTV